MVRGTPLVIRTSEKGISRLTGAGFEASPSLDVSGSFVGVTLLFSSELAAVMVKRVCRLRRHRAVGRPASVPAALPRPAKPDGSLCGIYRGWVLRTSLKLLPAEALGVRKAALRVDGVPRLLFATALAPSSLRKARPSAMSVDPIPPVQRRKNSVHTTFSRILKALSSPILSQQLQAAFDPVDCIEFRARKSPLSKRSLHTTGLLPVIKRLDNSS